MSPLIAFALGIATGFAIAALLVVAAVLCIFSGGQPLDEEV